MLPADYAFQVEDGRWKDRTHHTMWTVRSTAADHLPSWTQLCQLCQLSLYQRPQLRLTVTFIPHLHEAQRIIN